uniref:MFSD2 lysolipid transporter A, lysophospholipid b n=1 Tax=Cynoglossus semilaevis TaxID=244447 RepID=A0A3P8VKU6_CYNSE
MAKGEGGEQYSNASLLNKPVSQDGISLTPKREHRNRLSICNKLSYAIGGAPYQITGCALGFFLQIYLLDVAQLDPFYASIILFVGRAWDAVTDPTVGFLVSRSPWTRFGRMMPWILLSTPLAVLSYFLIWYVPPFENGKVIWYLFFYCLFQSLQTCFHVPYSALTMFISSEQKERDSATAYRMTVEVLGTVVGTAIQGQIVGMANAPCLPGPGDVGPEQNVSVNSTEVNNSTPVISLEDTKVAYMIASGVICLIYILCAIVLFFGVREQKESVRVRTEPMSFFRGIKLVMGHGPYAKLVMVFLFTSLGFMLLEGNFALFCSSTLGFRNDFQNILLIIMLFATLAIPAWQWFLSRFGKKTAVYVGSLSVIPFLIMVVCVKSNLIVTYIVAAAAGIGVASAFLLPWSMLPDVVDDFKVQNPTSEGHEALFYSFYVFFTKFASGVSLGVSTLSLDFAGYITRGCTQPNEKAGQPKVVTETERQRV